MKNGAVNAWRSDAPRAAFAARGALARRVRGPPPEATWTNSDRDAKQKFVKPYASEAVVALAVATQTHQHVGGSLRGCGGRGSGALALLRQQLLYEMESVRREMSGIVQS